MFNLRIISILLTVPIILSNYFGSLAVGFIFFHYLFSLKGLNYSSVNLKQKYFDYKSIDPRLIFVFLTLVLGILSVKFLNFQIFLFLSSVVHIAFSDVFFEEKTIEKRSKNFVFFQCLFSISCFYLICRNTDHNLNFEFYAKPLLFLSLMGMLISAKFSRLYSIHFLNEMLLLFVVFCSYLFPNFFHNFGIIHISLYHAWTWFIFSVVSKDKKNHNKLLIKWKFMIIMSLATLVGFLIHYYFIRVFPTSKGYFQQTLQAFGISHILATLFISNRNPEFINILSKKIIKTKYQSKLNLETQS